MRVTRVWSDCLTASRCSTRQSASQRCSNCVTGSAFRLFQFLDASELYVGDDKETDGDTAESQDILPQVPGCLVGYALLLQVRVGSASQTIQ